MPISYVGGKTAGRTNANAAVAVDLTTGLTGGSGGAPLAGDVVVVTTSVGTQARTPALEVTTPTGYTALSVQRTSATTYDSNVQTCYKVMTSTPDTSVTVPGSGNNADGLAYTIQVFRGVDPAVEDVTSTYATGSATNNNPDPAAITPVTAGAWIVCCGGGASGTGTTLYTTGTLTNFLSANGADTNDGTVGVGYYTGWTSGAYDPVAFGGGSTSVDNSWGATTLVLRPAADYQDADLDGSGATTSSLGGNATSQADCGASAAASTSLGTQSVVQASLSAGASSASSLAAQQLVTASFASTGASSSSFVNDSSYPEPLSFGEVLGAEILVYELAGDRSSGGFADTDMACAGAAAMALGAQALQTAVASSSATAVVTVTTQAVQVLEAAISSSAGTQPSFTTNAVSTTTATAAGVASSNLQLSALQLALWQAAGQGQGQVDAQALQVLSAELMALGDTTHALNTEAPKSTYFSISASSAATLPTGAIKQTEVNAAATSDFAAEATRLRQADLAAAAQAETDLDTVVWMPGGFTPAFTAVIRPAEVRAVMRPAEVRSAIRPMDPRDATRPPELRAVRR